MKSFSNETLNFFFRKFFVSYILDIAKTVRAWNMLFCSSHFTEVHYIHWYIAQNFQPTFSVSVLLRCSFMNKVCNGRFVPEFSVSMLKEYDKIRRALGVLARSNMQETKNFLKKKFSVSLEKYFIFHFHIYFSASFAFYFLVSDT